MKKIFTLIFVLGSLITFSQTNVSVLRLATDSTTFKNRQSAGQLVYDVRARLMYSLDSSTAGTKFIANTSKHNLTLPYSAGYGITISSNTITHFPHTGDVVGTTSLTVQSLLGRALSSATPSSGDFLKWDGTYWSPTP